MGEREPLSEEQLAAWLRFAQTIVEAGQYTDGFRSFAKTCLRLIDEHRALKLRVAELERENAMWKVSCDGDAAFDGEVIRHLEERVATLESAQYYAWEDGYRAHTRNTRVDGPWKLKNPHPKPNGPEPESASERIAALETEVRLLRDFYECEPTGANWKWSGEQLAAMEVIEAHDKERS